MCRYVAAARRWKRLPPLLRRTRRLIQNAVSLSASAPQMLNERVRLVASHLRNAMEYVSKLQNQTVVVQYERETLQDK